MRAPLALGALLASFLIAGVDRSALAESPCGDTPGPPDAEIARHQGPGVVQAFFTDATERYAHGVLGDAIEAGGLRVLGGEGGVTLGGPVGCSFLVSLPQDRVFEDVTPRIADVTGDGISEAIVIESGANDGAQLAIYGFVGNRFSKIAATPPIGTRFRWLAPAAIADFDGDGVDDVAYVETPHIGGILRIWSFAGGEARQIAARAGYSNHRIGENFISGGLRDCGKGPEIVLPDRGWRTTRIARLGPDGIEDMLFATDTRPETLRAALECP
ncbi:MAG: FG-GAP-like repeat-containing protein [Pseudomonadota bacterium]